MATEAKAREPIKQAGYISATSPPTQNLFAKRSRPIHSGSEAAARDVGLRSALFLVGDERIERWTRRRLMSSRPSSRGCGCASQHIALCHRRAVMCRFK